jgi:surfeit locus 1 family protein
MSPIGRRVVMAGLLLIAAGFAWLGVWQLGRLHDRRAANRVTRAARAGPPVALGPRAGGLDTVIQHRVVVHGQYDHAHDIVVRGDVLDGTPGVRLVTPLRLGLDGPAVLVDRGFLPAPDAVTVDPSGAREPGAQVVRGIALPVSSGGGEPIDHDGHLTWRRLDLTALREWLPYPVLPVLVQQSPDSALPRFPRRLAPPAVNEGPHLSYAIQWFLFAGLAAAFAVLVVGRPRRGER